MEEALRSIKVTTMLAHHVEAVDGMLYINGGGWKMIGPGPLPFGIGFIVEVPWQSTPQQHKMRLELIDADGQSVTMPTPIEDTRVPIRVETQFDVPSQPAQAPDASVFLHVGAVNFNGLQLTPGEYFEWRILIDGETRSDWKLGFHTRPAPPATT